ncbi:MAG: glycosyl transferase family 2 [Solirubrobacterales bacterium]|jgi:glycosyltransferase involved in cell wall biosynthesis|nr:glycosyl transferase family 2 [Solirubrobacterales bacterium]
MTADTLIIVAAYNEAQRIGETLDGLAGAFPGAPVWVADDGSTDRTPQIARAAGARVVRSERVIGKGGAVTDAARDAMRHALGDPREAGGQDRAIGDGPVFLLCDGDLGSSAGRLLPLVAAVRSGETDLAVAAFARRVGGGLGVAVGFARWAIRRRCGLRTTAPISGQRALTTRVLRDVLPFAPDFGMEVGMTIDAVRAGHRVSEIELDLEHRATGRTPAGFIHRARQLLDFLRVYGARGAALGSRSR